MRKKEIRRLKKMFPKKIVEKLLACEKEHEEAQAAWRELAGKYKAMGTIVVHDHRAFAHIKPILAKKDYEGFEVTNLEIDVSKKGGIVCTPTTVVQPAGRLNDCIEPLIAEQELPSYVQIETFKDGNGVEHHYGKPELHRRFFKGMVNIKTSSKEAVALLEGRPVGRVIRTDAAGRVNESWLLDLKNGMYLDLVLKTFANKSESPFVDESGDWASDVLWYNVEELGYVTTTAQQIKKGEATFPAANLPGFDIAEVMTEMTYGGIDLVQRLIDWGLMGDTKTKTVAQLSTRWAQWRAAQKHLGEVHSLCLYGGKVQGLRGVDGQPYEYMDGEGFLTSDRFADICNAELLRLGYILPNGAPKFFVMPDAVVEEHFQSRHWMAKEKKRVVDRDYLLRALAHYADGFLDGDDADVFIYRDDGKEKNCVKQYLLDTLIHARKVWKRGLAKLAEIATDADAKQELDELLALPEDAPHPYAGRYIYILPDRSYVKEDVEAFSDLNGMKTTFDVCRPSGVNLMLFGHTDGRSHTSGQEVATLMSCDVSWTMDFLARMSAATCGKVKEKFLDAKEHAPSYESFTREGGLNCDALLNEVFPRFQRDCYSAGYQRAAEDAVNGIVNDCNRLRTEVEGEHEYASPDFSAFLTGKRILDATPDYVETVCADLGDGEDAEAEKYPKMGDHEYMIVRGVGAFHYLDRSVSLYLDEIDMHDLWLLFFCARHAASGAMVLAAYQILNFLAAGYDNDGDHLVLKKLKELVEKLKRHFWFKAVMISEDDETEIVEKDAVSRMAEDMAKAYMDLIRAAQA